MTLQRLLLLPLLTCAIVLTALGGIRGNWKYNGVVIFDRWDACYLYSGVYIMPISEKVKESLRPFNGKPMLIDALEVWQPVNPGDGLITRLKVLGPSVEPPSPGFYSSPELRGLELSTAPSFSQRRQDKVIVRLRNNGPVALDINPAALAPTLFTKRAGERISYPSDGQSYAAVTRCDMLHMNQNPCGSFFFSDGKRSEPKLSLPPGVVISPRLSLQPGQGVEFSILIDLAPGEYEFLAGYGGGVHASRTLASNPILFDVDRARKAHLI